LQNNKNTLKHPLKHGCHEIDRKWIDIETTRIGGSIMLSVVLDVTVIGLIS